MLAGDAVTTDPDADLRERVQPVMEAIHEYADAVAVAGQQRGQPPQMAARYKSAERAAMLAVAEAVAEALRELDEMPIDEIGFKTVGRLLAAAEARVARLRAAEEEVAPLESPPDGIDAAGTGEVYFPD